MCLSVYVCVCVMGGVPCVFVPNFVNYLTGLANYADR